MPGVVYQMDPRQRGPITVHSSNKRGNIEKHNNKIKIPSILD